MSGRCRHRRVRVTTVVRVSDGFTLDRATGAASEASWELGAGGDAGEVAVACLACGWARLYPAGRAPAWVGAAREAAAGLALGLEAAPAAAPPGEDGDDAGAHPGDRGAGRRGRRRRRAA